MQTRAELQAERDYYEQRYERVCAERREEVAKLRAEHAAYVRGMRDAIRSMAEGMIATTAPIGGWGS